MGIRKATTVLGMFVLANAASFVQAAPPVVMKVLVLTGSATEPGYQSITAALNQIGVPYQGVVLNQTAKDSAGNRLSKLPFSDSSTGNGLYQGIIVTDNTFAACGSSCLSTADWTTLNTYASQFNVREVSYFTVPQAQWGLVATDSGTNYTSANPLNVTLTAAGGTIFPYLNASHPIAVGGSGSRSIRVYRSTTTAAVNETTTPLLVSGSYTVAVTHTTADGRETMALALDNAPGLLHSEAFGYGVISWVTRGIFLGSRRVYLNPQIDDMLLGNRLYAPTLPECPNDESCPTLFATSQDLQTLVNWQNNLKSDPMFSTFHAAYAFNGVGTTWFPKNDPVFAAIASLGSNFTWMSHTWDHSNLDCYTVNSNGVCVPATLAQAQAELNQNIAVAPSLGITLDRTSMVTPYGGGLTNPNFMTAAAQAGIQYLMTSAPPADPMIGSVSPVNSAIYLIPRVAPNLFDDVSVPQSGAYGSWTDEYNATFGPSGTQPMYSQNQTYSQILDHESETIFLNSMLTYDPCLLAFHIDNSSTYDGTHSMFSDLMDATITKYKNVFTLPVITLDMKDLAPVFKNRASLKSSGVSGVYTPGVSVALTTSKAGTVPITGACSQASCGTYGGQIQDNVVMAANSTVVLSLTSSEGVKLASLSIQPSSVEGGVSATGTVTLSGPAPSGGISVSLSSNNASAAVPGSVTVAAGSTVANYSVTTTPVSASASATISASYGGTTQTASLTITPATGIALASVSVNPTSVTGGTSVTGTVALSGPAPSGGINVSLSSNNAAAKPPASVTVPAGSTTTPFVVTTQAVSSTTTVTLTATYNGVSKTAALSVTPSVNLALSSVSVNPTSVSGGTSVTGTVALSSPAPSGGINVSLLSNKAAAKPPASVTVLAGSTTATFAVTTQAVSSTTTVTLTATYNGVSKTTALSVTPSVKLALSSVSVNPTSVAGGKSSTGTVTMTAAAPAGGLQVELWTTGKTAYVQEYVTVAAGSTTGTFNITTISGSGTRRDTITAFYNGKSKTAAISVVK